MVALRLSLTYGKQGGECQPVYGVTKFIHKLNVRFDSLPSHLLNSRVSYIKGSSVIAEGW